MESIITIGKGIGLSKMVRDLFDEAFDCGENAS